MALFGLDSGVEAGCREAPPTMAGPGMDADADPEGRGIRSAMSLAAASVGYGTAVSITAVGDSVNTASQKASPRPTPASW
jgi:hypothetical protein